MPTNDPNYNKLKNWFAACPGALIAFSGGVDSSLVAYLTRHFLGTSKTLAVTSASASLKRSDLDGAKDFCQTHDIPLRIIRTLELMNPDYFNNPANRCYFCKNTLYTDLHKLHNEFPHHWIINGTNTDDLSDYRPGLQAADEHHIHSPLSECGLNKNAVRHLAQTLNLTCWDKPASPCLSSRIPYGQQVTQAKLHRIEHAESWLQKQGFPICRVRHNGDIAHIEVPQKDLHKLPSSDTLRNAMQTLGFSDIEIDREGFISGKLNRALT